MKYFSSLDKVRQSIIDNNKTISKPEDIANSLNDYYISIADKIINKKENIMETNHFKIT